MIEALPPGDHLLVQVQSDSPSLIAALDISTGEIKDVTPGRYPIYINTGHLIFQAVSETTLLVADFDTETLELTSDPRLLADSLFPVGRAGAANVAVSETGRLLYRSIQDTDNRIIPMWLDREGAAVEVDPNFDLPYFGQGGAIALSPTGDRLAVSVNGSNRGSDIWIKQLDRGPFSRITFSGDVNRNPSWTTDGLALLFSSSRSGASSIWSKRADGSGMAERLIASNTNSPFAVYSHDAEWLVYMSESDLFISEISGEITPRPLIEDSHPTFSPAISMDDKWIAYVSNESGIAEVYVRPFPDVDSGRWLVSIDDGTEPVWANNGQELFYKNGLNELVSVKLIDGSSFSWDSQTTLFSTVDYLSAGSAGRSASYDTSFDDNQFIMQRVDANAELILMDNWFNEVRRDQLN